MKQVDLKWLRAYYRNLNRLNPTGEGVKGVYNVYKTRNVQ